MSIEQTRLQDIDFVTNFKRVSMLIFCAIIQIFQIISSAVTRMVTVQVYMTTR